jgi:hypothetical protein
MSPMDKDQDRAAAYEEQKKNNVRFYEEMAKQMRKSAADRTFFEAARLARTSISVDGLEPAWVDYEWVHSPEQGAKAACLSREDVVAIANVQYAVLKRLDRNRNYMWMIIALLLYIAVQFK